MNERMRPVVGNWYQDAYERRLFEVVAIDELYGAVEIQFFDGDIEEIDYDDWGQMRLVPCEAPEDWTGPYELDGDDDQLIDKVIQPENWSGPLAEMEPDAFSEQLQAATDDDY